MNESRFDPDDTLPEEGAEPEEPTPKRRNPELELLLVMTSVGIVSGLLGGWIGYGIHGADAERFGVAQVAQAVWQAERNQRGWTECVDALVRMDRTIADLRSQPPDPRGVYVGEAPTCSTRNGVWAATYDANGKRTGWRCLVAGEREP